MRDIALRELGKVIESLSTNEIIKLYELLLSRKEKSDLISLRQEYNSLRTEINHLESVLSTTRSSYSYRFALQEKIDNLKIKKEEIKKKIYDKKNN